MARFEAVRACFEKLNPYARDAYSGSILKAEDVNFKNGKQRELYAYAISAKRYALYTTDESGNVRIESNSEHGLGLYMNPLDPGERERSGGWMTEVWRGIVTDAPGGPEVHSDRGGVSR